jgi:hypothetical protein
MDGTINSGHSVGHVEDVTQIVWLGNSSFGHGESSQVGSALSLGCQILNNPADVSTG